MQIIWVVVTDEAGGIGYQGALLCHLPADLKHFKQVTWGKPIVMGRKTFESIGRPLPGRRNIVLTRQALTLPGVEVVPSWEAAKALLADTPEVMVIGGAQLYAQTLAEVSQIDITRIHHTFQADAFLPPVDWSAWECCSQEKRPADAENQYAMTFARWIRTDGVRLD